MLSIKLVAGVHGSAALPHAIFREKTGVPEKLIASFGATNDLLLVSRPQTDAGVKARVILMSALLDTATPVLMISR